MEFKAKMHINGVNPYVLVSKARAQRLRAGWKKPMPVLVQINGKPDEAWRINMMPKGDGSFYLYLHGNVRKASQTKVGDTVVVQLGFDEQYRGGPAHPMPAWFREALKTNKRAQESWTKLSPSRKKEILRYFAALKSEEARQRNFDRAISVLAGNAERFMGRDWKDGK